MVEDCGWLKLFLLILEWIYENSILFLEECKFA